MHLLELPQELLDWVGINLDPFAYYALRQTNKYAYEALGGDDGLRAALVALETYWSTEEHVSAVMREELHKMPEPFPSYSHFTSRAPCYTCLRISTPSNTLEHWHYGNADTAMLPWNGRGGIHCDRVGTLDLQRKCVECKIKHSLAKPNAGSFSKPWRTMAPNFGWTFYCRGCATIITSEKYPFPRQQRAGLCLACFDKANPGWLSFGSRLEVRIRWLQRYERWLQEASSMLYGKIANNEDVMRIATREPRPPQNDVQEDWELWKPVFEDFTGLDAEALQSKFSIAVREMQFYLFWMGIIDAGRKVCRHRTAVPGMLGDWPQWEDMINELKDSHSGFGTVPCGERCQFQYAGDSTASLDIVGTMSMS